VKICWGAFDEGRQQYYGEAGVLQFSSPTFMADAGVYLTTRLQGGVGQAVLSFSPSTGTTVYKAFHTPLVVRLLFKEVDFMLEPLLAGAIEKPEELEAMPEELHVAMERLLLNQLEFRVQVRSGCGVGVALAVCWSSNGRGRAAGCSACAIGTSELKCPAG